MSSEILSDARPRRARKEEQAAFDRGFHHKLETPDINPRKLADWLVSNAYLEALITGTYRGALSASEQRHQPYSQFSADRKIELWEEYQRKTMAVLRGIEHPASYIRRTLRNHTIRHRGKERTAPCTGNDVDLPAADSVAAVITARHIEWCIEYCISNRNEPAASVLRSYVARLREGPFRQADIQRVLGIDLSKSWISQIVKSFRKCITNQMESEI